MKNRITDGQGELFEPETPKDVIKPEEPKPAIPHIPETSQDPTALKIDMLKTQLSAALDDLAEIERLEDSGNLPTGASWRAKSLRELVESLQQQIAELDIPSTIFEVAPDEFVERFDHYYQEFKKNPDSNESRWFIGIIKLILKNPEITKKLQNNPNYQEIIDYYL